MATKSIYKSVTIRNKQLGRNLVNALEHAQKKSSKDVVLQKKFQEIKGDKIKEIFR
jgi:hypothetical protein